MGQLLHGSARTTEAIRRSIQHSQASIASLAAQYDLNPKTVAKWKKRTFVHDAPMGPKVPRSTVLTSEEEALIVAFRRHTLLPLDDCLYALQAPLPHLTRSALHRCLLIFTHFGVERVKVMRPVFAQIVRDLNIRVPSGDGCDYKTLRYIRRSPCVPEYGLHTTGHRPPRF